MGTLQKESLPEIAESYHKARKAYGLVAALLILWELVGIELGKSPIQDVDFTLQSPTAIPFILLVLIVYFGFRFGIEYYHLDSRRRKTKPAVFDYYTAHVIGTIAILIYLVQRLYDFQIFELIKTHLSTRMTLYLITGFLIGAAISGFLLLKSRGHYDLKDSENMDVDKAAALPILLASFSILFALGEFVRIDDWQNLLFYCGIGILLGILIWPTIKIITRLFVIIDKLLNSKREAAE